MNQASVSKSIHSDAGYVYLMLACDAQVESQEIGVGDIIKLKLDDAVLQRMLILDACLCPMHLFLAGAMRYGCVASRR